MFYVVDCGVAVNSTIAPGQKLRRQQKRFEIIHIRNPPDAFLIQSPGWLYSIHIHVILANSEPAQQHQHRKLMV